MLITLQDIICLLPQSWRKHVLIRIIIKLFPFFEQSVVRFNKNAVTVVDLRDAEARQTLRTKEFERQLFPMIDALLPDKGTFFDVGANFGCCTFGVFNRRQRDQISYYLFEPNPLVISCLEKAKNVKQNKDGDFAIVEGCATDRKGKSNLSFDLVHTGGGFIDRDGIGVIENIVLDSFIRVAGIKCIDFCKIDIEGSEPFALAGAKRSLNQGLFKAIYIEVSTENLERQGQSAEDILKLLQDSGFTLFWCREEDFEVFTHLKEHETRIFCKGEEFCLALLDSFPPNYQTDILALHDTSRIMKELQVQTKNNFSSQCMEVHLS